MTQTIRVGLSGAGTIGEIHAKALANIGDVDLVAVAEPRTEAGMAFTEKYGGTLYNSFEELLQQADIDVAIITTPSGLHPEQTVMAASAGKHVITEKPMAITTGSLNDMIEAANANNVYLGVIFQNRLSADVVTVKRAIEQGAIGTPVLANGMMYWFRSQDYYEANGGWRGTWDLDGGGALMNQAIHTVDLLQWLMGGIQDLKAFTSTLNHDIETEDTAAVAFAFENGALGTLTATTCAPRDWYPRLEIVGTGGRITLENNVITLWEAMRERSDIQLTAEDRALTDGWAADEQWGKAHERQLRTMFEAIRNHSQPYVEGNEARRAVDVILNIYSNAGSRPEADA